MLEMLQMSRPTSGNCWSLICVGPVRFARSKGGAGPARPSELAAGVPNPFGHSGGLPFDAPDAATMVMVGLRGIGRMIVGMAVKETLAQLARSSVREVFRERQYRPRQREKICGGTDKCV
jgi:hypothetical protein